MSTYNYDRFDDYVESGQDEKEFSTFFDHLHAGEQAPDSVLTSLTDGSELRLSELWARGNLVIEFGSFT
jgi:hypothetical protein